MAIDDDDIDAQLEAARRLNEELRRMELGQSSNLMYEDIYGAGGRAVEDSPTPPLVVPHRANVVFAPPTIFIFPSRGRPSVPFSSSTRRRDARPTRHRRRTPRALGPGDRRHPHVAPRRRGARHAASPPRPAVSARATRAFGSAVTYVRWLPASLRCGARIGGARSPRGSPVKPSVKRTFTSAPKTIGMGRRRAPNHYSFSDVRVTEIERENRALADRLARVETRPRSTRAGTPAGGAASRDVHAGPAHLRAASVSSHAINRRRANDKIARENAALLNRLNNIRPSKELRSGSARPGASTDRGGSRPASRPGRPRQPRPEWVD